MPASFEPQFIDIGHGPLGRRFAIHHPPRTNAASGLIVYVHPFAEEMNKARRMAARQARALADAGYAVLQADLLGCGDSPGDFGDATWSTWVDDVVQCCAWMRQRHGANPPLWLWGLRAGCLLAAQAAHRLSQPCNLLFWQAPASGKLLLQQFLRLKAAAELMGGQAKAVMEQLRADIAAGRPVEVAGYPLSAELCRGLEAAELAPPAQPGQMVWMEVTSGETATLSPVATAGVQRWQSAGWQVRPQCVRGPAFWQTVEIEDAPGLLEATSEALRP